MLGSKRKINAIFEEDDAPYQGNGKRTTIIHESTPMACYKLFSFFIEEEIKKLPLQHKKAFLSFIQAKKEIPSLLVKAIRPPVEVKLKNKEYFVENMDFHINGFFSNLIDLEENITNALQRSILDEENVMTDVLCPAESYLPSHASFKSHATMKAEKLQKYKSDLLLSFRPVF